MKKIIIALDGHSGCGKSTVAKHLAHILGYKHMDSGALYRAITYYFLEHNISITNPKEVARALKQISLSYHQSSHQTTELYLNGINVEKEIRSVKVTNHVSATSKVREVRSVLLSTQRQLGKKRGIVIDGRDIGTVVFPDSEIKIFLTADIETRASRRQKEWLEKGQMINLDNIIKNLSERDKMDSTREESPLRIPPDALLIDTTHMTIDEEIDEIILHVLPKIR